MNSTAKYGSTSLVGLLIVAGALYYVFRPHPLDASCPTVVPNGNSTVYGIDLTDGDQLVMAVVHFYPPGGFRHNIAILEQTILANDGSKPNWYDLGSCSGTTATMTMENDVGTQLSTWTFAPGSTSTTYNVTVKPFGTPGYPTTQMNGIAYLMNTQ